MIPVTDGTNGNPTWVRSTGKQKSPYVMLQTVLTGVAPGCDPQGSQMVPIAHVTNDTHNTLSWMSLRGRAHLTVLLGVLPGRDPQGNRRSPSVALCPVMYLMGFNGGLTCVRSTGKPKVSHNSKASLPGRLPPLGRVAAAFLKRSIPFSRVLLKLDSSSLDNPSIGGQSSWFRRYWTDVQQLSNSAL
jgi:hypothetical protein